MACNAIVYQPAVVVDDELFKQLTDISRQKLADILAAFVKTAYPSVTNAMPYTYGRTAGVEFSLKTASQGWRSIKVEVTGSRLEVVAVIKDAAVDDELAARFTAVLRQVAGREMQIKLAKAAGRVARVNNVQPAANGALLLNLELD